MKKTLIALAALAATGAFAQNVTVYGRLDAGYAMTTNTAPNAAGASVETKANGVQSHNSVSSMWGLKGTEDLGGGMNAFFILEQDIYPADGNTGVTGAAGGTGNAPGFNRTSLVGVNGGFGTLSFGRDYNAVFKLIAATDVNSLSRISTVQLAANIGGSTIANMVNYSTPDFGGFKVNVNYGNQDSTVSTNTGDTSAKVMAVTAVYANGPLMVGVGTGSTESKANGVGNATVTLGSAVNTVTTVEKITGNVLGASYDFGKVKLVGNAITYKATSSVAPNIGDIEQTELNLGVSVPMGKVTLVAQLGTNKAKATGATEDWTGSDFVIGADYALSARTALFAKTGTYGKLSGNGQDFKSTSTAVGIKTSF